MQHCHKDDQPPATSHQQLLECKECTSSGGHVFYCPPHSIPVSSNAPALRGRFLKFIAQLSKLLGDILFVFIRKRKGRQLFQAFEQNIANIAGEGCCLRSG
jgi:hypothetical protein